MTFITYICIIYIDNEIYQIKNGSRTIKKALSLLLLFAACTILPSGYEDNLRSGTWTSIETITTTSGTGDIIYTQNFLDDGTYDLTIDHPIDGVSRSEFYYEAGYYYPKYAVVFFDLTDSSLVVGLPMYFFFDGDTLVTSTNANLALPRRWTQ